MPTKKEEEKTTPTKASTSAKKTESAAEKQLRADVDYLAEQTAFMQWLLASRMGVDLAEAWATFKQLHA